MKVSSFIVFVYYVILDYEAYFDIPIILGRLFLTTGRVFVDMESRLIKFRLNDEHVLFNVWQSTK